MRNLSELKTQAGIKMHLEAAFLLPGHNPLVAVVEWTEPEGTFHIAVGNGSSEEVPNRGLMFVIPIDFMESPEKSQFRPIPAIGWLKQFNNRPGMGQNICDASP